MVPWVLKMANETDIREFDWKECPWCSRPYRDRNVLKVQSDQLGPKLLFLKCDDCGTTYPVERKITWQARLIERGKPLHQEVAEFLDDRQKRFEEHSKAKGN